jgi:arginyl-tRNA--protein-N-Asp/Glu arginylyltransferase
MLSELLIPPPSAAAAGGGSHCGYCGSKDGSVSFGTSATRLSPLDLESLFFAGWRRSGSYIYALDGARSCCVAATIRLDVTAFAASREQRKLVERLNRYLRGEPAASSASQVPLPAPRSDDAVCVALDSALRAVVAAAFPHIHLDAGAPVVLRASNAAAAASGGPAFVSNAAFRVRKALSFAHASSKDAAGGGEGGGEPVSIPSVPTIAGVLEAAFASSVADAVVAARAMGARAHASPSGHLNIAGDGLSSLPLPPPSLPPAPAAPPPRPHTWRVEEVPAAFDEAAYKLYERYQVAVHGDAPGSVTRRAYTRFLCESPVLRVPLQGFSPSGTAAAPEALLQKTPAGSAALSAAEGAVARAWEAARSSGGEREGAGEAASAARGPREAPWLIGFGASRDYVFPDLVRDGSGDNDDDDDDDQRARAGGAALATGYGTAHHRYFLDGVLVAVAVVDVTPRALSSVYAFYDPVVAKRGLPLGKLTALREIQWLQAAAARQPTAALRTYLMGYYIDSCPKMRYKAEYAPSELLCPQTRAAWVRADVGAARLRAAPRAPIVAEEDAAAWRGGERRREAAMAVALARAPIRQGKMIFGVHDLKAMAPEYLAEIMPTLKNLLAKTGDAAGRFILLTS